MKAYCKAFNVSATRLPVWTAGYEVMSVDLRSGSHPLSGGSSATGFPPPLPSWKKTVQEGRAAAPQMKGYFFLPAFHLKTIFIPLFLFFIISSLSFWPTSNSLRYDRRLERETERRDDFQTAGASNACARVCVCAGQFSAVSKWIEQVGGAGQAGLVRGAAFSHDAPVLQSMASL